MGNERIDPSVLTEEQVMEAFGIAIRRPMAFDSYGSKTVFTAIVLTDPVFLNGVDASMFQDNALAKADAAVAAQTIAPATPSETPDDPAAAEEPPTSDPTTARPAPIAAPSRTH